MREFKRYQVDILGVSERRRPGSACKMTSGGQSILFSKEEAHASGVALIMSYSAPRSLKEWEISDKLQRARIQSTANVPSCSAVPLITVQKRTKLSGMSTT